MKNDQGVNIISAGPSTPVEITGLNGSPAAGDKFMAFESEKEAKEIAEKREIEAKNQKQKKKLFLLMIYLIRLRAVLKRLKLFLSVMLEDQKKQLRAHLKS